MCLNQTLPANIPRTPFEHTLPKTLDFPDNMFNMTQRNTRPPAVAGKFYPGEAQRLEQTLNRLFQEAGQIRHTQGLVGIMAPHAGYQFAGIVAARAYLAVDPGVKRFVLLGASHYAGFSGVALSSASEWQTPLGNTPVDTRAVEKLVEHPCFFIDDRLHEPEHSLEAHLPFIQHRFPNAVIVPALVGSNTESCVDPLLELLDSQTVLVMSTDLYHGDSYQDCVETDAITLDVIQKMNPEHFIMAEQAREIMLCGTTAVALGLRLMKEKGARASILTYTNSAEVTGNFSGYVVGYAALAFVK